MNKKKKKKYKRKIKENDFKVNYVDEKSSFGFLSEWFFSYLRLNGFIFGFIVFFIYQHLLMFTDYFDHNYAFENQPNLIYFYIPPLILIFIYGMSFKVNPKDFIGGNIITHSITILAASAVIVISYQILSLVLLICIGAIAAIVM